MKNCIKVERARHNITQAELAEKIQVSRQTINSIELNRFTPSTILAIKISNVFDMTVNELFSLEKGD